MRHRAFSVFDVKAQAYLPPFFMPEQGQAHRVFSDMVNKEGHAFCDHPEDYTLFYLGDFDDSRGVIDGCDPELVVAGLSCVVDVPALGQLPLSGVN